MKTYRIGLGAALAAAFLTAAASGDPAASSRPRQLLPQGPVCRIPVGSPGEDGSGWTGSPELPAIRATALRPDTPPSTTVRALAENDALYVRFDCEAKDPRTLIEGAKGGDRVWVEIFPGNDPVERLRFEEDFRGDRKISRLRRITGESSLEVVPDIWEAKAHTALADADFPMYHGLAPGGWFAEFVIPWKALGLSGRPAAIGFNYGRKYGDTDPRPVLWEGSWPFVDRQQPWSRYLGPGQALIGESAVAPAAWETESPRFGLNRGRLQFGHPLDQPLRLVVRTDGMAGASLGRSEVSLPGGATSADFTYQLSRAFDSHLDVFAPQRVVLRLETSDGATLYTASMPFGRHLGICVGEPYGEAAAAMPSRQDRERWLESAVRALPLLERRTTRQGAPSDYCLVFADGKPAANLMADDAWASLAGIVESRFATAEDRLVGAMALIGQKSVTNLFLDPIFFNAAGYEEYHSAMHELMGPLSVIRYGGGSAVSRAAVLAALLQHITDPATGRPFVTRVISLTAEGGPAQTDRHYPRVPANLGPFGQVPGRIGAVAVDYHGSQTLLDPTALAFFPAAGRLATLEEIAVTPALRQDGAGRLADAYGKIDLDELRHQPADRLLSRGVFPEQAPEEDGKIRPYEMGYKFEAPVLVAGDGESSRSGEFLDEWRQPGLRRATVQVKPAGDGWDVTVAVRGVALAGLGSRDRAWERVHLFFDVGHTHHDFLHFLATAAGKRGSWAEESDAIQTFCKHLATENWREVADLGHAGWTARFVPTADGYEAVFNIPRKALGLGQVPPVMGFNVWIEGRAPHYEEEFLSPPGRRLPADPMTFGDLYAVAPPVVVASVDLGIPTWMENQGMVRLTNAGGQPLSVRIQAFDRLSTRRKTTASPSVSTTVPGHGEASVKLPFFLDPEEKMEAGGPQHLVIEASAAGAVFYRSSWGATYAGPISVYQRYGSELGPQAKPAPGDPYYGERMIRWMSSQLPRLVKRTTRDGAKSDFVLRAEDGSVEFDLMDPAALHRLAAYVEGRFSSDLERVLALYCLDLEPNVGRHNSGGHHLMLRAEPVSILRGNFAGGGGNCGFHSALFAGLASELHIAGKRVGARTVSVWGHDIMALDWRGSRTLLDDDTGQIFFTPEGNDFATIEEFRANPWRVDAAGAGEIGRYYSFSEEDARSDDPGVGGISGPGIFPISTLAAAAHTEPGTGP